MIPYYLAFLISILFCWKAETMLRSQMQHFELENQETKRKKRDTFKINIRIKRLTLKKYHLLFFLCVLVVTLLAGMRDYSIGTDIRVYGNPFFYYAHQVSLSEFISNLPQIEPLYLGLVYFSSLFSSEPHILYFFTGLVIYIFILSGLMNFKEDIPITMAWTCILFLFYGDTLNAMRQSIAIAISLWALHFAIEKKYIAFVLGFLLAFFSHNSAIIILAVFGVYFILQKNNGLLVKIFGVAAFVGGIYFFNQILTNFMMWGIIDSKMSRYFIGESTGMSILAILIRVPFLALIIMQKKKFCEGNMESSFKLKPFRNEAIADFYILMLLAEILTIELSAFVASLYRISLFFVPFRCIAYARIYGVQKGKNRLIIGIALIVYLLIIFIYQNQIKGNNEIYPYIFGFFN